MPLSDRCLGLLGLTVSFIFVAYLLIRLVIIPVLPLDEEYERLLLPPTYILLVSATLGFAFVGSLAIFTMYTLYQLDSRKG